MPIRVSCAWSTCAAGTRLAVCPTVCVSLTPPGGPASARSFFAPSTSTLRSGTLKKNDVPGGIHSLIGCANPRQTPRTTSFLSTAMATARRTRTSLNGGLRGLRMIAPHTPPALHSGEYVVLRRRRLQLGQRLQRDELDEGRVPRLERGEPHGAVGYRLQRDRVEMGQPGLPLLIEPLQLPALVRLPLGELEGPRPDRLERRPFHRLRRQDGLVRPGDPREERPGRPREVHAPG